MFSPIILSAMLLLASAASEIPGTFSNRVKRSALDNTISTTFPTSFDWREYGKVTSVKNQGQCGSAWAHAVVASVESQYLLQQNQSLDLSEQDLLNCEMHSDLCYSSDNILPSFNYAKDVGLPLESCAPYISGINGNVEIAEGCEACTEQRFKIAGFQQYGVIRNGSSVSYSEGKIAEDLYNFGPAAAVIYLPPRNNGTHDFYDNVNFMIKNYTGGVLDIPANICNAGCQQMIVVLLVGYTPDYWIAKTSLGPNWGENGYFRFKRGTNFCSMTKRVIAPFLENSVPPSTTTTIAPTTTLKPTTIALTTTNPASFDWRDYGKVTSVKNQGQCGSAWAHAVVASVESQYLLQQNQSLDLSEQDLLNCEMHSDLCYSSDNILPSFNYAKDIGLPLESCAPYISGANGNVEIAEGCEACTEQRFKIAGFRQYGVIRNGSTVTYSEEKIAEDLYNFGPAAAVIYLPPRNNGTHDFYDNVNFMLKNYSGGVLDIPSNVCNAACMQMIVVLLVGYTPDYWIAKTSLGPNWGENGYLRFKRGTNFCSMTKRVIAPFLENSLPATPPTTTLKPTTTTPSGWTEWAASSCTANCGQCGRTIMKRICRGGICTGADTMNSTTICGAATLCQFPLSSCCAPAKRAVVNAAIICV